MTGTYKHSYKMGEPRLNALSVYNVGYQKCEPEYQWGPGIRDHYCIHHILSGHGYYFARGTAWHLQKGDTFILYPGEEVRYYADKAEPWEYAWVGFMGTEAGEIIRNTEFAREKPYILNGQMPNKELRKCLEKIYDIKGNTYEAAVAMTGALYSLLSVFIRYYDDKERTKDVQMLYVEQAQKYIEKNYSYSITVEDVAAYVGISRSHLFRSFKLYTGKAPKEYLSEYRIEKACDLLRETELSISTIAYSVGFDNNLYFSKVFKKYRKVSPSVYRRLKKGTNKSFGDRNGDSGA